MERDELMKIAAVVCNCNGIVQCVGNAGRAVQRRCFATFDALARCFAVAKLKPCRYNNAEDS
uniref:Uncharacterized protein n=1 Tax=Romanomermis culicivorax TaxID=13658 RepID=A0A915JFF0_ROMCU